MQNTGQLWYQINDIDEMDSPALVIYLEHVKHNISTIINAIADVDRLRPHIKTHKSEKVTNLMIAAGIHKFKCATIAEAELLGKCEANDVLLAYQPVGPKLKRFLELIKKYPKTRFSCLVDDFNIALQLDSEAQKQGLQIAVYIDLNVGQNRTGIKPNAIAIQFFEQVYKLANLKLLGFHAYDGHIQETNFEKRTYQCVEIYSSVAQLKQVLVAKGFDGITLIMGGSPSFPIYSTYDDVECSPGTFVFWDKSYLDMLPEQEFLPAALVVGRVISIPAPDRICLDVGHKSIASENLLADRIFFLNAPELEFVGHSEEHLMVKVAIGHHYQIGDVLYGLPFHICPTCALYAEATLVERGKIIGVWEIKARNRKIEI